jgi:ferredoxin
MTFEGVLVADVNRCTGCGICELVCSMDKHGECNPDKSRIRVLGNRETYTYVPVLDMSCDLCARCVRQCPSEALSIVPLQEALLITKEGHRGRLAVPRIAARPEEPSNKTD